MSEPSGTQYGGFWIRFLALLADSAIVFLICALAFIGASLALGPESLAPVGLGASLLGLLYWPLMHASRGQATFGKAIVGLKVSRFDGRRISIVRSAWREIAKLFSGAVLLLGYVMAAFTPRKRALHDLMSATYVVREGPARVIPALALALAGFALPVFVVPMVVGAAAMSSIASMTSMAESLVGQQDFMKQVSRVPTPAKPAPKPAAVAPKPPAVVAKAPVPQEDKPAQDTKFVAPPVPQPTEPAVAAAAAKPKTTAGPKTAAPNPKQTVAATAVTRTVATRPAARQSSAQLKYPSGLRHNDLMSAVLDGDVDSVNQLLKLGKWADKPDSRGATPLMVAAGRGDVRTAEALLRGGADARLAAPVAEQRGNGEMISLLKRYAR